MVSAMVSATNATDSVGCVKWRSNHEQLQPGVSYDIFFKKNVILYYYKRSEQKPLLQGSKQPQGSVVIGCQLQEDPHGSSAPRIDVLASHQIHQIMSQDINS